MNARNVKRLDAKLNDIYDEIEMSDTNATDYHIVRAIMGLMDALQIIKKELAASEPLSSGSPAPSEPLELGSADVANSAHQGSY